MGSLAKAFRAQDWPAARSLVRADFRFEDRRRGARVIGDVELWAKNLSLVRTWENLQTTRELIATIGDRIAIERIAYTGDADGGAFEGEFIRLTEIDTDGDLVAVIHFDAREDAVAEAEQRLRATTVSRNDASRLRDRISDAFMAKDWKVMRALARDDLVFEDRRKFSMLEGGVEEWVKSAEIVQSMSGVTFKDDPIATIGDRIDVRLRVVTGRDPNGGAFESEFLVLTEADADGLLAASINFDLEAQADALAEAQRRFEALCADPEAVRPA